ncbi:MAG: carboxypeptidase-like regulatory domain-containing protein, partial [Candidatus Acidiferrales bacterium]
MNLFRLSLCFGVLLCLFSSASPARGQTVTANLQGQVLDASGGGVPKAKVSAVNTETAFSRSTESDSSGEYSLPAMPPGRYTVSAQLAGFKTDTGEITLQVGQVATLNFTLAVGAISEKVEVQAQSEVTEPTRTQI